MSNLPLVALVGRTNVGKSSLFNELLGAHRSLVADKDAVTRDCIMEMLALETGHVVLVDTGGLDREHSNDPMDQLFLEQTWAFLSHVQQVLYVIDAGVGLLDIDKNIMSRIASLNIPIALIWHKSDLDDDFRFEKGSPALPYQHQIRTSIRHKETLHDLLDFLAKISQQKAEKPQSLSFGFFGRPNVGKSSLSNALLGKRQMLVSATPGTTRDFVSVPIEINGQELTLIDTAGLWPQVHKHPDMFERMIYYRTLVALKKVTVAVLVLDASAGITHQDLKVLKMLEQYRRGVIIAINKWDLLTDAERQLFHENLQYQCKAFSYCPMIPVSALKKIHLRDILTAVLKVIESFNAEVNTGEVNRILELLLKNHQPPLVGKYRIKMRYAHVVDTQPLTILIHGNQLEEVPVHYKKYLRNGFCRHLELVGIPLKLEFKTGRNPYQPTES